MRFTRLIPALTVAALGVACAQDAPTAPDAPQFSEHAGPPHSGPPLEFQFPFQVVPDPVNPCTGETHVVSGIVTLWIYPRPNNVLWRTESAITTDDGYTGSATETWAGPDAGPGGISARSFNAMMTNPYGSRIRVHQIWVFDRKTNTGRVDQNEGVCVQP